MTITLDGLSFDISDFTGSNGLGHTETQDSTTGASGEAYPEEKLFPDRVFRALLNQISIGQMSTSTSSHSVSTGSKVFALSSPVVYGKGAYVEIASISSAAILLHGRVTAVSGLNYTVDVTHTEGAGSGVTDWVIMKSGPQGPQGVTVLDVNGLTEDTLPDSGDMFAGYSAGDAANRKFSEDSLYAHFNSLYLADNFI